MKLAILLQVFGALLGVAGTYMMANVYTSVHWKQRVRILLSALFRGPSARDAVEIRKHTVETPARTMILLQGLALIGVGFLFKR